MRDDSIGDKVLQSKDTDWLCIAIKDGNITNPSHSPLE
jgi:hypothetical protein